MRTATKLALAASLLSVPLMGAVGASAAGSVQRNQVSTTTYTVLINGTFEHVITVMSIKCDGTSATTGVINVTGYGTETATVTSNSNGTVSIAAVYDKNNPNPGYSWSGTFPAAGGPGTNVSGPGVSGATDSVTQSSTAYANHGQYVSGQDGGSDAAHSCIGMPVQSQS